MEQHSLKNVSNCLNTTIYSYLETSGGKSYNLYWNVVHFFNNSVNYTSVAAQDSCFPALVYKKRLVSLRIAFRIRMLKQPRAQCQVIYRSTFTV
jgi:hypothetical protein